jgi:uncharacterized protein
MLPFHFPQCRATFSTIMADEILFDDEAFSGQVRLFPLPNVVMFPHVIQPLHVFEPRYRQLVEDALLTDKLVALAVLAPGWESDYEGRPELYPTACLGKIATHEPLEDGRYNLLLLGLRRVTLFRELPAEKLYREAEAHLLDDDYPPAGRPSRSQLQDRLIELFRRKIVRLVKGQEALEKLLAVEMTLGTLTDLISYTLDFEIAFKAQLLAEANVDRRASTLIARLEQDGDNPPTHPIKFPPDFSPN